MALEVATGSTTEPQERQSSSWLRLEQQIDWYDRKSTHAKRWYHRVKVTQILVAAAIPVTVAANADQVAAAVLGASIVVLEGFQQLFQFHANWTTYRSTCERLKHEKYLYAARGGPYGGKNPDARLAERVEGLVSQEHAAWTTTQRETKEGAA
jgi:hypothetical protein